MQLTDLCVSLDLARELAESGYLQDTVFVYTYTKDRLSGINLVMRSTGIAQWGEVQCAAPTSDEVGAQLPNEVALQRKTVKLEDGTEVENQWCAIYAAGDRTTFEYAPTEVEARAKMWLFLKRNGLLKEADVHESR